MHRQVQAVCRELRIAGGGRLFAGVGRHSSLGTLTPQGMIEQFEYLAEQGVGAACTFHARALTDDDLRLLGSSWTV